ncbi:hypothetical protein SLS62_007849 [Diatrype stigma]|uniref:HTH TFE/IIEalpha-type domain-containing protein n=1 Tax=Diatrype stigma TaxID=117547 RepID=A0AAN9UKV6_9PEZI
MDLAQTLVRSVVRAFYDDAKTFDRRHILVVDALVIHSALRDDDMSYLMNMNLKDLHKICGRLREDRFIQVHVRPELREGQQRPTNRTYYYIDYRQAIDAIKWRVYTIDKEIQSKASQTTENKLYFCPRCKAEYSELEVIDAVFTQQSGFLCHRCNNPLIQDPNRLAGGHEESTKLNNQLKFITDLLPQLDSVHIPDNTFEVAHSIARPVVRDAQNQVAQSVVVESIAKPTAVKGMANTGPKSIAISITDAEGPSEAEKEAERLRKEKKAQENALPEWHVKSTVTGTTFTDGTAGTGTGAGTTTTTSGVKIGSAAGADDQDVKKEDEDDLSAAQQAAVDDVFARLQQQQQEQEDDEDDEEEEEEEDEEFEDIGLGAAATAAAPAAAGKVTTTTGAVGSPKRPAPSSGTSSAADTPSASAAEDRPAKKVKVEEPAAGGDGDSDEDVAFEDV